MLWKVPVLIRVAAGHNRDFLGLHLTKCVLHISDSYIDKGLLITVSVSSQIPLRTREGFVILTNNTPTVILLWPIVTYCTHFTLTRNDKYLRCFFLR
jgi:hypothetical protein